MIEDGCCHNTVSVEGPAWDGKCWAIVENYNLINQIPEDDSFGRTAYRNWYYENLDNNIQDLNELPNLCQNWIDNYLAGGDICE